jgi:hypothetical protein
MAVTLPSDKTLLQAGHSAAKMTINALTTLSY